MKQRAEHLGKSTHISLFTGAGGLDIGLEEAGFETRIAVEYDRHCRETIEQNRHDFRYTAFPLMGDITAVSPGDILETSGLRPGEATLVSGGPPCQPYSTAGRRGSIGDPRGSLFFHYVEVIRVAQPRFFVMENVRGLLSSAISHRPLDLRGNGHAALRPEEELGSVLRQVILPTFERLGYELAYGLVNALDYGTPQSRERLVFIGSRDQELGLEDSPGEAMPMGALIPPSHTRDGSDGKGRWQTLGDGLRALEDPDPEFIPYTKERREVLDRVPPGKNWRYLRDTYGRSYAEEVLGGAWGSTGGRVGFWRRLSFDKWSPTLTASPIQKGTCLCHPEETRPLSVAEYARIQGFPDRWQFAGSTAAKYRQIGNAVPSQLAKAIGDAIMGVMARSEQLDAPVS